MKACRCDFGPPSFSPKSFIAWLENCWEKDSWRKSQRHAYAFTWLPPIYFSGPKTIPRLPYKIEGEMGLKNINHSIYSILNIFMTLHFDKHHGCTFFLKIFYTFRCVYVTRFWHCQFISTISESYLITLVMLYQVEQNCPFVLSRLVRKQIKIGQFFDIK